MVLAFARVQKRNIPFLNSFENVMKNKKNRNTCKDADIFDPVSKPPNYFPPGKRSFTALAVVIAAIVIPAEASEKEKSHARHYAIAAQPLGDALTEFADQSDLKLVFDADLVRGLKSRGLSSTLTPEQGLDKLLDGTGFGYRFIGPGTVTIERLAKRAAKPNIAPAAGHQTRGSGDESVQLATVSVTGEAEPQSLTTPSIEELREKLERVPGGTTLIEGERIREGAALTVNDALAYAPGVYVGDRIRLRGSYTWSNFHFDDDPVLKDNRLPGIPEHNARFEALYQHPGGFYIGPNVTAVSSNWVDFTNTLAADAYALLGARVGWDDGKHWKVFVDGRNLTNERYAASVFVTGDAGGQDVAQFNPGATRMVFGGFEYRY